MKKIISYLLIGICCLGLSGCGSFPEMTASDQKLIAEYAAGMLLQYSEKSNNRLTKVDEATVLEELLEEPEQPVEEELPVETPQEEVVDNTPITDNTDTQVEEYSAPINDAMGVPVLSVQSGGYEIKDYYPDGSGAFFSLDAVEGCKLLVLKYTLTNNTDSAVDINMLDNNISYKVSLDGGEYKYALATMLLDDLSTYVGTLNAGESVELVLISEWKEETLNNITNLTLQIKNGDLSGVYPVE